MPIWSSLKKCPKPSGQGSRPPHPYGQCPNAPRVNLRGASLSHYYHSLQKSEICKFGELWNLLFLCPSTPQEQEDEVDLVSERQGFNPLTPLIQVWNWSLITHLSTSYRLLNLCWFIWSLITNFITYHLTHPWSLIAWFIPLTPPSLFPLMAYLDFPHTVGHIPPGGGRAHLRRDGHCKIIFCMLPWYSNYEYNYTLSLSLFHLIFKML